MALSKLDIYNQALNHIGLNSRIASETEETTERRTCDLHYPTTIEEALTPWDWTFAHTEMALVDVGTPPAEWLYRYTYPANCLVPRYIVGEGRAGVDQPVPFAVMRFGGSPGPVKVVVTDKASAVLAYTFRAEDDEANYPVRFATALAYGLAAKIAAPLTQSVKATVLMTEMYNAKILEAMSQDAEARGAVRNRNETNNRNASSVRYE